MQSLCRAYLLRHSQYPRKTFRQYYRLYQSLHLDSSHLQKLANGTGAIGTRAVPTHNGNNNKKIGLRLDYGEKIVKDSKEYQRYKLQIGKGADKKTLSDKDSHKVWSTAGIPVGEGCPEDIVEKLCEDLETD